MEALKRFLDAQDSRYAGYETALKELRAGLKQSHWIWYIFPQMKGLGHSGYSNLYGISSLLEAKAYLEEPVLSARLREAVLAVVAHAGSRTADEMLGRTDALKLRSSLTLFDIVCPGDIFAEALTYLYEGKRCGRTLDIVAEEQSNYMGQTAIERHRGTKIDESVFFEMNGTEAWRYSMMCRTTIFLDCVMKGESMRKMVERYLWDRDLSAARCEAVKATLGECLLYGVNNNRYLHKDAALFNAVKAMAEGIHADDVLGMAERFDTFVSGMMSNPVTWSAMKSFVESY